MREMICGEHPLTTHDKKIVQQSRKERGEGAREELYREQQNPGPPSPRDVSLILKLS